MVVSGWVCYPSYHIHKDVKCRNQTYLQGARYERLEPIDPDLAAMIKLTPESGTVQRIYSTRVGQGIAILSSQYSLIDSDTGLPIGEMDDAQAYHHRMLWVFGGLSVATIMLWRAFK